MKYKPRTKYYAVKGVDRCRPYIAIDGRTKRLHIYTDKKQAEKECVGNETVEIIEIK